MVAPRPVKAFLCHTKGNNNVHLIALGNIAQVTKYIGSCFIICHKVCHFKQCACGGFQGHNTCVRIFAFHRAYCVQNGIHFIMDACRNALIENGIWMCQYPVPVEQSNFLGLVTKLTHVPTAGRG